MLSKMLREVILNIENSIDLVSLLLRKIVAHPLSTRLEKSVPSFYGFDTINAPRRITLVCLHGIEGINGHLYL